MTRAAEIDVRWVRHRARCVALAVATSLVALAASAQDVVAIGRAHDATPPAWIRAALERDRTAFEFTRAWKAKFERVKEQRLRLALQGIQSDTMVRESATANGASMTGTLRIPVLPILYRNTVAQHEDRLSLQNRLFSSAGTATVASYYREVSQGQFTLLGTVQEWTRVSRNDTEYEGTDHGGPPNLGRLLVEVLDEVDKTVNFAIYDRDGDGYVDVVAFVQPESGGECSNSNIWSHRWTIRSATGGAIPAYKTNDGVMISDYTIQPALECDGNPVQIGVFAHEFGHALGLPDLYETGDKPATTGIGSWGLMAYGGTNLPPSPAHMESWSRSELGWITSKSITCDTTGVSLEPTARGGSAIRLDVPGVRGEYFLLENRQPIGSDANLFGAGLLVWHIDSVAVEQGRLRNIVENNRARKGVALLQADGKNELDKYPNVGDDGDPYPGAAGVRTIDANTVPSTASNAARPTGIAIKNITIQGQRVSFDIRYPCHGSVPAAGRGRSGVEVQTMREPPVAKSSDATGPLGLVRFSSEIVASDLAWLESNGFKVLKVFEATQSVFVQTPRQGPDPLAANKRIAELTVQSRGARDR